MIVLAIRETHARFLRDEQARREVTASLAQIRELLPAAAALGTSDIPRGGRFVLDGTGERVGYVVQTLPAAKNVIGYSGPNNLLLAFDTEGRLAGALLLSSGDTRDHVRLVRDDADFLARYRGRTWDELVSPTVFDGVSGATLTSAAIVEGIVQRLGGRTPPSFRFPALLSVDDAMAFFPDAKSIDGEKDRPGAWRVLDAQRERLGYLLRTSPGSDSLIGYQGPTDGLLALDAAGKTIVGIGFKESYDTPQYVEDVTLDWTFMHRFDGMPIDQFAALTVGAGKEIEGVSGATLTSQTLIENLTQAAGRFRQQTNRNESTSDSFLSNMRVTARDVGTAVVVLLAALIAFTNLRGRLRLRRVWQVVLIVYLGFVNADLLSQALFVGWSQNGIPWRLAPGLVLLSLAALAVPFATKTQLYCHHLCPHGAAQELLRNRLPWKWHLPHRLERVLSLLPAVLLAVVVVIALWQLPVDLAGLEPFDAYAVRAAGGATIAIAVVGLVASLFVPMAYCRYGCPTGALLGYVRRNAKSGRLTLRDAFAALVALVAAFVAWGLVRSSAS